MDDLFLQCSSYLGKLGSTMTSSNKKEEGIPIFIQEATSRGLLGQEYEEKVSEYFPEEKFIDLEEKEELPEFDLDQLVEERLEEIYLEGEVVRLYEGDITGLAEEIQLQENLDITKLASEICLEEGEGVTKFCLDEGLIWLEENVNLIKLEPKVYLGEEVAKEKKEDEDEVRLKEKMALPKKRNVWRYACGGERMRLSMAEKKKMVFILKNR